MTDEGRSDFYPLSQQGNADRKFAQALCKLDAENRFLYHRGFLMTLMGIVND
jgi:hypothetical protein